MCPPPVFHAPQPPSTPGCRFGLFGQLCWCLPTIVPLVDLIHNTKESILSRLQLSNVCESKHTKYHYDLPCHALAVLEIKSGSFFSFAHPCPCALPRDWYSMRCHLHSMPNPLSKNLSKKASRRLQKYQSVTWGYLRTAAAFSKAVASGPEGRCLWRSAQ